MARKAATAILLALLAGCVSARNYDAVKTWRSTKDADSLAACLVPALLIKHTFPGDYDITHHVETVVPGKVFEVRPQQTITVGVEQYFVRLTVADSGTDVALFANPTFRRHALAAVDGCI
jgi:uncharacterized lipoprotein